MAGSLVSEGVGDRAGKTVALDAILVAVGDGGGDGGVVVVDDGLCVVVIVVV